MTKAEWLLWLALKGCKLDGLRFRRQHPIGDYIADFACLSEKLVVELDGATHDSPAAQAYDARRDAYLEGQGWRVLRLDNDDVYVGKGYASDRIRAFVAGLAT